MTLYIWRLEQNENNGYDTYDSCVVVSESEEKAKQIHPSGYEGFDEEIGRWYDGTNNKSGRYYISTSYGTWANSPEKVGAIKMGIADPSLHEGFIICASFNAG
jgi:hypothetical protein